MNSSESAPFSTEFVEKTRKDVQAMKAEPATGDYNNPNAYNAIRKTTDEYFGHKIDEDQKYPEDLSHTVTSNPSEAEVSDFVGDDQENIQPEPVAK